MVFGTFDKLHKGHVDFFKQAKKHGQYLLVVVGLDETVTVVKGRPPRTDQLSRLREVASVPEVDFVRLGYRHDPYQVISEERPDIIALGYDQQSFTDDLKSFIEDKELPISIVRLKPFKPERYKSSLI